MFQCTEYNFIDCGKSVSKTLFFEGQPAKNGYIVHFVNKFSGFLLVYLLTTTALSADPPGIVQSYLEDSEYSLTYDEIRKMADEKFIPVPEGHFLSKGFTASAYWVKASISGMTPGADYVLIVEFFPIDKVEYFDTAGGKLAVKIAGDSVPGKFRELKNRNHVFRYTARANTDVLFFRIDTRSTVYFPLKIYTENEFSDYRFEEQYLMGLFFGIIGIMVLYNFLVFVNLRDTIYLYYVAFTASIGFYLLIDYGYAKLFFWDEVEYLSNFMNPFMGIITAITSILLAINFLELKRKNRNLVRVLYGIITVFVFFIVTLFFIPLRYTLPVVNILVLISAFLVVYGIIREIIRRNVMAYFFAVAFSSFIFIAAVSSFANIGFQEQNFISTYGFVISTVFDVTTLSFALGYRINILRRQKEYYQSESIYTRRSYNLLKNEVEIAARIQNSILPKDVPVVDGIQIEAVYMPHGNIGGDLYDFFEISKNELGVLVADVTGHGIPAALLASRVNFSFSFQEKRATEPASLLAAMNSSLYKKMARQFLTAIYAYINMENRKLVYASAGHPPLIVWNRQTGRVACEKPKGRLMGVFPETGSVDMEINLEQGDRLLLFSDGLSESFEFDESSNGLGSIVKLLKKTAGLNLADAKTFMVNELAAVDKNEDDVTFVLIDID